MTRFIVFGVVVVCILSGCSSGANSQGNSSDLPIAQLLAGEEDFGKNLTKNDSSEIAEFDSAIDGVFPHECPGITQELLSHVDRAIVQFTLPVNFKRTERNDDFTVTQEVFRFETAEDSEAVIDAVQRGLSNKCSHTNALFEEFVTFYKKLTLSDGPFVGFTWEVDSVSYPSVTCAPEKAVWRKTYWANISGRDVYVTTAAGNECFDDPVNSAYPDLVNAAQEAVDALSN